MKIMFNKRVILLTNAEAREAEIYGSKMYRALIDALNTHKGFNVEVESKSKKGVSFKGMTREFMLNHIKQNPKEGKDLLGKFYTLCGLDETGEKRLFAAVASVGELRMWFLNEYPEFNEGRSKIKEILDDVKKAAA